MFDNYRAETGQCVITYGQRARWFVYTHASSFTALTSHNCVAFLASLKDRSSHRNEGCREQETAFSNTYEIYDHRGGDCSSYLFDFGMDKQRPLCNVWNTWLVRCNIPRIMEAAVFTQTLRS